MLWGKVLRRARSPTDESRRIDTSRAEQLEGVKAVVTGRELRWPAHRTPYPGHALSLADDVVRFAGEKVAAVAAVPRSR